MSSNPNKQIFIILGIFLLLILISVFIGRRQNMFNLAQGTRTKSVNPIITLNPTPPIPISTYTNSAGFFIAYASTGNNVAVCNPDNSTTFILQPRKVFQDGNKIYLSFPTTAVRVDKVTSNGYVVPASCSVKTTDINLLENGWDEYGTSSGEPQLTMYPEAIKFIYKTITSDADIVSLSQQVFGNGCTNFIKQPISSEPNVYSIRVSDKNGMSGVGGESKCGTNYGYDFYYSVKNNVAVAGNMLQNCPLPQVDVSGGVRRSCGAEIVFSK